MTVRTYNQVPSNDDQELIKTLAFPFQAGAQGFPALAKVGNNVFAAIISLLMTSLGERVMRTGLGLNLDEYVFETMTPIKSARLANAVANAIETFIVGTVVNSVSTSQLKYEDGVGSSIVFDIQYTVGGESQEQQIIYPPTLQGQ